MTYNQQGDGYNTLNNPLPGTTVVHTEDAGLGHAQYQPQAGFGGGASNEVHHGQNVGIVDKIKNAVLPGHHNQSHVVSSTPLDNHGVAHNVMGHTAHPGAHPTEMTHNELNAMFPHGVTDNADVRHQNELIGGSAYPVGGTALGTNNAYNTTTTAPYGTAAPAYGNDGTTVYNNTTVPTTVTHVTDTNAYGTNTQGATAYPITGTHVLGTDPDHHLHGTHAHGAHTTDHAGAGHHTVLDSVLDALIPGHKYQDEGLGTHAPPGHESEYAHNNMAFPPPMPKKHDTHHETIVSNANTTVSHVGVDSTGHHVAPHDTHTGEHKQGGIKGLIAKVTGH